MVSRPLVLLTLACAIGGCRSGVGEAGRDGSAEGGTDGASEEEGTDNTDDTGPADGTDGTDGTDGSATEDADGDGFAASEDCDDNNPEIYPGAEEYCDGIDTDCSGVDDDAYAVDAGTWALDADGDGFGDPTGTVRGCTQPENGVTDNTDCHDDDAAAYPGSHETETPFDGTDTDCDGDDFCTDLNCDGWPDLVFPEYQDDSGFAPESTVFYGALSGFSVTDSLDLATVGASAVKAADLNGDGYLDLVFASSFDGNHTTDSRIHWGSAAGHSAADSTDLPTVAAADLCIGDFNTDGHLDLLFAQVYSGSSHQQDSFLYWGSAGGFSASDRTELYTWGARTCDVGDVDGDGYADLLFSSEYAEWWQGYAYLYWGSSAGYSTGDLSWFGSARFYNAHLVDVNADGFDDVLLPAYYDGDYATYSQLWYGSASGLSSGNLDYFYNTGAWDAAVGDFDGDGRADIAFSNHTTGTRYETESRVYYQSATGFADTNVETVTGRGALHVTAADLDGDGLDDLVQSNLRSEASLETASSVWSGSSTGLDDGARTDLPTVGSTHHATGDLNGDGYPEIVFGSSANDSGSFEGQSTIYWGAAAGYDPGNATALPTASQWRPPLIVGAFE